jgi:hypothetical protein
MPQDKSGVWSTIVVPAAIGIEKFFWSVAWFALMIAILFGTLLFPRRSTEGGPQRDRHGDQDVQPDAVDRSPR